MEEYYSWSIAEILMKVGMFVVVQALVYLILSKSSDVFSKNKMRSLSFKTARSVSIRRILAVLSDLPPEGEASPPPPPSPQQQLKAEERVAGRPRHCD